MILLLDLVIISVRLSRSWSYNIKMPEDISVIVLVYKK
jgi:hypothetical protein